METNLPDIPVFHSPWWCLNDHIHTISRSLFGDREPPACEQIEIATPDRDFLELDCIFREDSKAVVALFHGLEGSTRRYYIIETMKALRNAGFSVVAVNFRGCGSRLNRTRRFYHSGETEDYFTIFRWISEKMPGRKIGAVGFSLGANALLKSLGEKEEEHPVDAAVAISAPYDLKLGADSLSRGFNRVYEYLFLRTLRKKVYRKREVFPDLPEAEGTTLYEFDNKVTAPVHGFKDADDYYESCSSKNFMADIRKPVLLIHSKSDPLCPIEAMPRQEISENPSLDYIITGEGGHVGFWSNPPGWLNRVVCGYLTKKLKPPDKKNGAGSRANRQIRR